MTNNGQSEHSLSENSVDKIKSKPSKQSGNGASSKRFTSPVYRKVATSQSNARHPAYQKCKNCGGDFPHRLKCPAIGVECHYCHKKNHFISVCRKRIKNSRRQHLREIVEDVSEESDLGINEKSELNHDSDPEVSYGLKCDQVSHINSKVPCMTLKINDVETKSLIDTGSSLNIINERVIQKMSPRPRLQKSKVKAYAFGQKKPLAIKGKYTCTVESDQKFTTAEFHVVADNNETIISYQTAVSLNIIPSIRSVTEKQYSDLCDKYAKVFQGLGKLKDREIKFHIDESVVPVAQSPRRIPFHLRDKVEKELERLEKMDVIEPVNGATPWVSNLVVAPKANTLNDIRLCVDMRKANQAIKRERHVTPTIDDIVLELNGSKVFSKVDLYKGFHQCVLSEESRNMTVFATHVGLRRYKRLNFGVCSAPEIFQNEIRQVIEGLSGTLNISDDIIIHGKTRAEHDRNLKSLLQRLSEKGLTLNRDKCEFGQNKIKFYGFVFSEEGFSPDPEKVEAIKNVERPKNQAEVRSFLGMTNYVSRFIDNYSTLTEPLRRLTRQDTGFVWTEEQAKSFNLLKESLVSDAVMTYFDPSKPSELWVDASPVGVSGILIQNNKIVSYGSRALSPTEQRYSQTEREALACVWGCEHFHLYLFGKEFTLITDHAPLESIMNGVKTIQSARLERFRLRLTTYNFKVKYRSGKLMISDYCSRHPFSRHASENIAEGYCKLVARAALPASLTLSDIAVASETDTIIKCALDALQNNTWEKQPCTKDEAFQCYKTLSNELSAVLVDQGYVLLRGTKLCIPESLQQHCVDLSHEGHQGRVKCKALLRENCWFPFMDRLVDETCKNCLPCQAFSSQTTPDPIKPGTLPKQPFDEISVDFSGPYLSGHYFMVVLDDYSRFPIVERITNITADTVIPRLETIFSIWGIPSTCRTDNGAPFHGHKFAEFAKFMGFEHRKITPRHPMGNSQVERFMQPLNKAIKTAVASGKNYQTELHKFLLNYRNTPHPATNMSPSQIVFGGRKVKTKLPQFTVKRQDKYIRERDTKLKMKNKRYADQKRHTKPCTWKYGDMVLVKRSNYNKEQTVFYPTPAKIIRRKGSMVTVKYKDKFITRDVSQLKFVKPQGYLQNQQQSGRLENRMGSRRNEQDRREIEQSQQSGELRRSKREIRLPKRFVD